MVSLCTADREEAQERCAQVYFPHRLTVLHDPAQFAMSLSATDLGPVSVGLLGYTGEVRLETDELETGYEVNIPLTGQLRTRTGQAEVLASPNVAAVYRPDSRTMLHGWTGGGRLFGLKIQRTALESELGDLVDTPIRSVVPLGPSLDLRRAGGRQWWSMAASLMELADAPDGPLSAPIVTRPLVHSVVVGLLHVLDHPYRELLTATPRTPRPAVIREAVELLETEPQRPFSVADLARAVGLSSRALQHGFARHVGVSPMGYLRRVRLRRVHEDLRLADPARHGVAEIATRWGFTHFGRFAAAYREQYGVPPSATLRHG